MKIEQSGEPVGEVVSLALVKLHCRIRHNDDDGLIGHYIASAVEWVSDTCQTVFLETEFTATGRDFSLSFDGYPNPEITAVTYIDRLGATGTITDYEIRDNRLITVSAPQVSSATVIFKAGLGAGNVPVKLVQASLMLAASFYQQRSDLTGGMTESVPYGVKALVTHHRSFAF